MNTKECLTQMHMLDRMISDYFITSIKWNMYFNVPRLCIKEDEQAVRGEGKALRIKHRCSVHIIFSYLELLRKFSFKRSVIA